MPSKNQPKILIAEDEKSMSKAMVLKFTKSGFDATPVYDGEEAVVALEKSNFDVLLLDLIMPKLDGFGVLEKIKEKKFKVKVIVTSNLSQEEDIKRAKDLGAIDYIVKSDTQIQDIVNKIATIV
jgi:DNA-binding response OmpR family regulator